MIALYLVSALSILVLALAANKNKPHGHQGVLEPYDGKPLPLNLTPDQKKKLEKGESVLYNERSGKSGRGVVIQDVNASVPICMDRVRDLGKYPKMVPHVKRVEIYDTKKFGNGTTRNCAQFDIGLMGLSFQYFLKLTHEPKYNTLTWTLDYDRNSDFDDNCGHWQFTPHPSKKGWTRVLYSCKVKLFSWIPEFVINFLTSKALTESTTWVKREAEIEQAKQALLGFSAGGGGGMGGNPAEAFGSWFNMKGGAMKNKMKEMEEKMKMEREKLMGHNLFKRFPFRK